MESRSLRSPPNRRSIVLGRVCSNTEYECKTQCNSVENLAKHEPWGPLNPLQSALMKRLEEGSTLLAKLFPGEVVVELDFPPALSAGPLGGKGKEIRKLPLFSFFLKPIAKNPRCRMPSPGHLHLSHYCLSSNLLTRSSNLLSYAFTATRACATHQLDSTHGSVGKLYQRPIYIVPAASSSGLSKPTNKQQQQ